jgi:DNA-binding NtrC family response regulator
MVPPSTRESRPDAPTELVASVDPTSPGLRVVATWEGGSTIVDLPLRGTLTVGRGVEADVRVDHTSVSRKHARIVLADTITVEDLGSSNGTKVRGRALAPSSSQTIEPGDLVELGSTLLVVHRRGGAPESRSKQSISPAIVVADPAMERVYQLLELVAKSNISVLFIGETGVGKEILASHVHRSSPRASSAFLKVNCAALVESLLEAELFGHERGAFTGALQAKAGLLEGAHQGTLFLDEVGELPLNIQAKLLRVLESGEVTRVGALAPRKVDVRFVAATNRDLKVLVATGKFREDLFFRLDGITVRIPPLRERKGEIPALANSMVVEACKAAGRGPVRLSDDAIARLLEHAWPGNIRELKNVIRRSVVLCPRDVLRAEDISLESEGAESPEPPAPVVAQPPPSSRDVAPASVGPSPGGSKKDAERARILEALRACGGNQTRAAQMLGLSRRTFVHKLDILGVPRPRKKDEDL